MMFRLSLAALAFAVLIATPLNAQGIKDRSVLTDRSLKESNPARDPVLKGASCSCARPNGAPIPCGTCVGGLWCPGNNRTPVRNAC